LAIDSRVGALRYDIHATDGGRSRADGGVGELVRGQMPSVWHGPTIGRHVRSGRKTAETRVVDAGEKNDERDQVFDDARCRLSHDGLRWRPRRRFDDRL
jgi:hypothetical protein